jgi:Ca2+-binding RTX toxin-like protein
MARQVGDGGPDRINGTDRSDLQKGRGGDDVLKGNNGSDVLFGGAGDDSLFGGDNADILRGGPGNDRLDGGRGDDVLLGGRGRDTFVFSGGNDEVRDFDPTQDNIDLQGANITALRVKNDDLILVLGDEKITLVDVDPNDLSNGLIDDLGIGNLIDDLIGL